VRSAENSSGIGGKSYVLRYLQKEEIIVGRIRVTAQTELFLNSDSAEYELNTPPTDTPPQVLK